MERQEIEAELNEVERDLAGIARRAHITACNLRSVADATGVHDGSRRFAEIADCIERLAASAKLAQSALARTRVVYMDAKPAPVAAEGGAE